MTYLGYQVAHLEEETHKVKDWLELHCSDYLKVDYLRPGRGNREECSIDFFESTYLPEGKFFAFNGQNNCINFTSINFEFTITVEELPKDRWGNTATYEESPDCVWILYADDASLDFNDDIIFEVQVEGNCYDYQENREDFYSWLYDRLDDDRWDTIGEVGLHGESWSYTTVENLDSLKMLFIEWIEEE